MALRPVRLLKKFLDLLNGSGLVSVEAQLGTRLDQAGAERVRNLVVTGTDPTVVMLTNNTNVVFGKKATLLEREIAQDDWISWIVPVSINTMNAAVAVTFEVLIGGIVVDAVTITTGDADDYARLIGHVRFTKVGATSLMQRFSGDGVSSDGGTPTRTAPVQTYDVTGPDTRNKVDITVRVRAATGNAGNVAQLRGAKFQHHVAI